MQDHAPYAHAFNDLDLLTFIELLEDAARYLEALARDDDGDDAFDDEGAEAVDGEAPAEGGRRARPARVRALDLALAAGFVLRVKAEGWKLFCRRMNVPPFLLWEGLPGFDRLQRALALAEEASFVPEGLVRWLNRVRPAGEPARAEVPLTPEGIADAAAGAFRRRVEWWGGGP
jgi:hypothetical protein